MKGDFDMKRFYISYSVILFPTYEYRSFIYQAVKLYQSFHCIYKYARIVNIQGQRA